MKKIWQAINQDNFENFVKSIIEYENTKKSFSNYNPMLVEVASKGYVPFANYLLTSSDIAIHSEILHNDNLVLKTACEGGHLDMVKYLLTSPDLVTHSQYDLSQTNGILDTIIQNEHTHLIRYFMDDLGHNINWQFTLSRACQIGSLKCVQYLLTSPELKTNADIHHMGDTALSMAARERHLDIVKYLTTSPELTDHITDKIALLQALQQTTNDNSTDKLKNLEERFNVFEYLLTCPQLKNRPDLYVDKCSTFKSLLSGSHYRKFIDFCICDLNSN